MIILKQTLSHSLSIVNKAVSSGSPLPILTYILLKTHDGILELAATNLELSIKTECNARLEMGEELETCVPAKLFTDLINAIQGDQIVIDYDPETMNLQVKGDKSVNNIKCLNSDVFPVFPEFPEVQFTMDSESFTDLVNSVSFAASDEVARPVLNGILFECQNKNLMLATANGFMLAKDEISLDAKDFSVIIPVTPLNKILSIFEDEIEVALDNNKVFFKSNKILSAINLIDGRFPNISEFWKDINSYKVHSKVDSSEFLAACKHVNIFCKDLAFETAKTSVKETELILNSQSDETGDSQVSISASSDGEIEFYLNSSSLIEFGKIAKGNIRILAKQNIKPILFQIKEKDSYLFVMMPINL